MGETPNALFEMLARRYPGAMLAVAVATTVLVTLILLARSDAPVILYQGF